MRKGGAFRTRDAPEQRRLRRLKSAAASDLAATGSETRAPNPGGAADPTAAAGGGEGSHERATASHRSCSPCLQLHARRDKRSVQLSSSLLALLCSPCCFSSLLLLLCSSWGFNPTSGAPPPRLLLLSSLSTLSLCLLAKGRRGGGSGSSSSRMSFTSLSSSGMLSPEDLSVTLSGSNLHAFTYAELHAATGSFSRANYLGCGGFGPVYRGAVDDKLRPGLAAQTVAVKYLDLDCGTQGHKEWLAEVFFLGQLRHKNLVKLIGYCYEDEHRMLVYEFMSGGSLENHLFKSINGALPWMKRMKIAVGAAKGLAFLHDADPPVIYRDFKASNILLDKDYDTKLSDFGLAKDGPEGDATHVTTTRVMGTHGYAAPEYIMTGHLTAKSDVYSFGVVLLELLSGRQSVDRKRRPREQNLVDWARPYLKRPDRLYQVMDPALECQYSCKGAEVAALVAYKCLSQNPKSRPTMKEVVKALEPVLDMDDFFPVGPFVFTVIVEEDKVVEMKVEVGEKPRDNHQNHQDRHREKYPNSAIHAGIVLHGRDGVVGSYTGALRRHRRTSSNHAERGA